MLASTDQHSGEFISFLEKSLSINSTTEIEEEMTLFLKNYIEERFKPDQIELQEVAKGRFNIIAVKGNPKFFMSTHVDTVPKYIAPYFSDGKIYGRGACDAKGQIALQLWALDELVSQGVEDYGLVYVVGEEVDSIGAYAALMHPLVKGKFLLNGEPTENKFASFSKGVMEIQFEAKGSASHTSITPVDSAIHKLCHDIATLTSMETEDLLLNAGIIEGGVASNVSADSAKAEVCVRYIGDPELILKKISSSIQSTCSRKGDYVLPSKFFVPTEFKDDSVKVSFCSDASILQENFDHVMLFGSGSIKQAHEQDEYLDLKELEIGKDKIVAGIQSALMEA